MPLIDWEDKFSVNIEVIDEQHKMLLKTINKLYDATNAGTRVAVLDETFKNLAEYTTDHFATEEELMVKFGYPDYVEHKNEHERCVLKVLEFKKRFDEGDIRLNPFFSERGLA
jgi:hemerythrin